MKSLKSKIKKDMYPWKIESQAQIGNLKRVKPFNDDMIPKGAVGFVGKKALAAMTDKRAKKYETVIKLDYENYFSSNKELKQAYKDGRMIYRTILKICFSKMELTYEETKAQFKYEVLERDNYLNGNILGRFYKGKI